MAELNYNLDKIFEDMELELIRSMKRNIHNHRNEELKEGFNWEMWQSAKLRELRAYRKRNANIIYSYMNDIPDNIKKILTEQYNEGADHVDAEVNAAIDNGYITKTAPDFGKVNDKKLNALIDSVNNDFEEVKKAVLRKSIDIYRQTVFTAEMSLAAGAKTLNQAVDMATKLFLERGIDCITYSDGRKVNIASYAKMAVRTAHTRAYLTGEGQRRREWKECLVMTSQYMQCSETCLPWQGRVYVDDVYSGASKEDIAHYTAKGYKKLSVAISGGLFHPNCRHTLSTWFEDISTMPVPLNEAEVRHNREQIAKENHCKKQIQKYKRLKEGSLDKENIQKYDKKVKQWQAKLKEVKGETINIASSKAANKAITSNAELKKSNQNQFTNRKENGTIKEKRVINKSVTIPEDCEHLLNVKTNFANKDISQDILVEINNAIENQKNKGNVFNFDEILVAKFNNDDKSVFVTELEVFGGKHTNRLYLNSKFFKGVSLKIFNEKIKNKYNDGWWMSKTLGDLVNHEIMHAKINSISSFEKIERLYDTLKYDDRVKGFCKLVDKQPDEFLNEMFVALNSNEQIEQKYTDVYNEYIKEFFEE